MALRTELDLDAVPASVPARFVSVSRHVLYVNGVAVGRGPVRANPRKQPYDDVDLAPCLRPGRNVIGAIVTRYGNAMPWYLPAPELSNDLVQGAFVLEADLGGGRWLVTDDTWQGTVLDGWTAGPPHGIAGRSIEHVDARSLPASWHDEDPGWPAALLRRAMTAGEPGRPEPPSYPYGPFGPRPTTWPATAVIPLVDEGDGGRGTDRVSIGTLVADAEGPAGATVTVRAAEFRDAAGRPEPNEHDAGVTFTLDGRRRTLESLDSYGLQGVLVELSDGAVLHDLALHERTHPVAGGASFRCSDPLLEEVWAVGRRTVSICSTDSYLDCPTREQRAWTGDSVVHQMVDLTTNEDWTLARWHPRLAASPRPDGMLPMACAGDAEHFDFTVIPDWALHWVHSVWNLHRYVGDREEIGRLLPVVEGVLRWFEPFCDDEGVPTDVYAWVIIDWASVYTEGVSASLCGLWGRGLLELAEMARWLGDEGRARWAEETHARLRVAFERLWDPTRERYVDSLIPGQDRPMASQHGQAAAIVGGLAPEDRVARLVEVLTHEPDLVHAAFSHPDGPVLPNSGWAVGGALLRIGHPETPWWDAGREVVRAQPFYRYVVHDALVAAGRADLIPAQCRDWAWALERSATSLTETWYGGTISHGWSSTPTRDLVQRVLGVTPGEPGFAVASIEPELGDLEWAAGAVPTPAGLLHLEVRDGQLVVDSPIPFDHGGQRHPAGQHTLPA